MAIEIGPARLVKITTEKPREAHLLDMPLGGSILASDNGWLIVRRHGMGDHYLRINGDVVEQMVDYAPGVKLGVNSRKGR